MLSLLLKRLRATHIMLLVGVVGSEKGIVDSAYESEPWAIYVVAIIWDLSGCASLYSNPSQSRYLARQTHPLSLASKELIYHHAVIRNLLASAGIAVAVRIRVVKHRQIRPCCS